MIQNALQFTAQLLNQYIKNKFSLHDDVVICNAIVNADNSTERANQNKVVVSFINLELDKSIRNTVHSANVPNIQPVSNRYNLDILVASNFDSYDESLKFLDAVITFFHTHPVIDSNTRPNMPDTIEQMSFEMEKLGYQDTDSLWNALNAIYRPSVIYKLRLVSINTDEI
ncbi:DUF4255 domain-containing protein [Psychroserpens algicola]|uniref:DUF4255 domain-containing protein n=1 Tax=Psychroserpens algicola TaxID=1719034 RepID=A0ABT0H729_9FLAO|nr:DUF4255 domain-containing protein [Psychroserpens algicola]MCK8480161.1 DUF4255 domain-containing protein [Psychroserpens algicola]